MSKVPLEKQGREVHGDCPNKEFLCQINKVLLHVLGKEAKQE